MEVFGSNGFSPKTKLFGKEIWEIYTWGNAPPATLDPRGCPRASPRLNAAQVLKLEPPEGMLAITYGLLLDKHIKIRLHNNMNKAHTQVSTAATRVSLAADAANAAPAARAARFSPAAAAECLPPPTAEAAMLLLLPLPLMLLMLLKPMTPCCFMRCCN